MESFMRARGVMMIFRTKNPPFRNRGANDRGEPCAPKVMFRIMVRGSFYARARCRGIKTRGGKRSRADNEIHARVAEIG